LAKRIILLIYGQEYTNATGALQILIWTLIFIFLNGLLGNTLVAINQQKRLTYIMGGGAILNIVLNMLLIPLLSYKGAAISTVVTEIFIFSLYSFALGKLVAPSPLFKVCGKPLLAVSIMGAFIVVFSFLPIIVVISLAAAVYIVMLSVTQVFDREDRKLVQQVFRKEVSKLGRKHI